MVMQTNSEASSQIVVLERVASNLEALLNAVHAGDGEDIERYSQKNVRLRKTLSQMGRLSPEGMNNAAIDRLKAVLFRIKQAESNLEVLSPATETRSEPDPPATRALTDEETKFLSLLEADDVNDFSEFVPLPRPFTTSSGVPLVGFDSTNLHRAVLHITAHGDRGRYDSALGLIEKTHLALIVEQMSTQCLKLAFPSVLWEKYYAPIKDDEKRQSLVELLFNLYAAEGGLDIAEVLDRVANSHERQLALCGPPIL